MQRRNAPDFRYPLPVRGVLGVRWPAINAYACREAYALDLLNCAVMASLADGFHVLAVKEQRQVAFVGLDVVDHCCWHSEALGHTSDAEWMLTEEQDAALAPRR